MGRTLRIKISPNETAELTKREYAILMLVAEGWNNHHIAKSLFISNKTVEGHLSNIYNKLKADNDFADKDKRIYTILLYLQAKENNQWNDI